MNSNNQRRMQINDKTSRPCSTPHEIIKTIPKRTVSPSAPDEIFPLACATLSGVPRGRCSCRRYHGGSDLLFSFSAQTNGRWIFRQLNVFSAAKKVQKIKTTTRPMEQKAADWRWQPTLRKWLFLCAPTGPKRAGPLLPSSSSATGGWGTTTTKKLQAEYFRPHRERGRALGEM